MVSSGIPISNAQHAPELADMALTLCHGVTKFRVTNVFLVSGLVNDICLFACACFPIAEGRRAAKTTQLYVIYCLSA